MSGRVCHINQYYWRDNRMPYIEIRTTRDSLQGYKDHSHHELSVAVIESGQTLLSMKGKEVILQEGDILIIEPNVVHSCNPIAAQPRSYHMLYIDVDWCCEMLSTLYKYKVEQLFCKQNVLFMHRLYKNISLIINKLQTNGTNYSYQLDSLLFDLLSLYYVPVQKQQVVNNLAYKVKQRLQVELVTPPSLEKLSQDFGHPKEVIIRAFKRQFAITPKSFINNTRIEKSKFLLKMGMRIVDVATEVGFFDQSQFHRAFVHYTASTPRQYQQAQSIFDNNH